MTTQTQNLAKEWNGALGSRLNSQHVLAGAAQLAEVFDGSVYSRIHRRPSGMLVIEERKKGSMYATSWELVQEFSEMESELQKRKAQLSKQQS